MSLMPFFRRNLFYPLWVFKDKSPRLKYMKAMEKAQYLDFSTLRERQFVSLKNILEHAFRHTEYYNNLFKEHGINPDDIKDENDYRKVPILTKDTIRDCSEKLLSDIFKKDDLIPYKTGGSTGVPLTIFKDFLTAEQGGVSLLGIFFFHYFKSSR